jgi:hypothetical protein
VICILWSVFNKQFFWACLMGCLCFKLFINKLHAENQKMKYQSKTTSPISGREQEQLKYLGIVLYWNINNNCNFPSNIGQPVHVLCCKFI